MQGRKLTLERRGLDRPQSLVSIRGKILRINVTQPSSANRMPHEGCEDNSLNIRSALLNTHSVSIALDQLAERHLLEGLRVVWEVTPVRLDLHEACPRLCIFADIE